MCSNDKLKSCKSAFIILLILIPIFAIIVALLLANKNSKNEITIERAF